MRRGWATLTLVVGLAAGCGGAPSGDGGVEVGGDDGGVATSVQPTTTWPAALSWDIEDVERTADPMVLDLRLAGVPVEGSTGECAITVTTSSSAEASPAVDASVSTDGESFDVTFPGCDVGERTVPVRLIATMMEQGTVRASGPSGHRLWVAAPDGSLQRCELPACDPGTGRPPEPPGCNAALYDDVKNGALDVPRRSDVEVRVCEVPWAIVDIDVGASACPAGEEPNHCAGTRIHRYFFELRDGRWHPVFAHDGAGCGDVHDQAPGFPLELCDPLEAIHPR